MIRTFVASTCDHDHAWQLAADYAWQLRAYGLAPSHRMAVQRRGRAWWVVLVIDEDDESES